MTLVVRYAFPTTLPLILLSLCIFPTSSGAQDATPKSAPDSSAVRSIDVSLADGVYVIKPIVRSNGYDKAIALENSRRIHAIMTSARMGPGIKVFFPAGHYYFEGVVEDWLASIETTHPQQTIAGEGINATHLHQVGNEVTATIKIRHSRGTIENLSISSADYGAKFRPDWDANPHQAAIHLAASDKPWSLDPQILNVTINSTGNNIATTDYYRPFKEGIKITGPWLNVYVHTMFMREVFNAININQGGVMAGPAKFIDVNVYATVPPQPGAPPDSGSKTWNTFFRSEGHFMEQVELIHCTYIGSQFIYMDGSKSSGDTTPVYNMIVDHCYINTLWLPGGDEAKWSGIYMKLPPKPGGIVEGYGSELYSRAITFTNNTAAGKSPRDGAFFYVEGNLKQLVLSENQFASGGSDQCIYVHPATALIGQDTGIKDIEISHNIFHDFRNPITIGDKAFDPSRQSVEHRQRLLQEKEHVSGLQEDEPWIESVLILDNQTFNLPVIEKGLLTTSFLHHVRQITISGNTFAKTDGSAFVLSDCRDIVINGNNIPGFKNEAADGIHLIECENAILTGNLFKQFTTGVRLTNSRNISLSGNQVLDCSTGVWLAGVENSTLAGNLIDDGKTALYLEDSENVIATGNLLSPPTIKREGKNEKIMLQKEWKTN